METLLIEVEAERKEFLLQLLAEFSFVHRVEDRKSLEKQLQKESAAVADTSMEVLAELEQLNDDYEAI